MGSEAQTVERPIILTVGIPAYNAGASLERAILSILRQAWRGTLEILVVDDGSTDDTVAVATRLSEEYGAVRVVCHDRNHGRPAARNTVLREASGLFLTWMDADDEWYPNKLAVQFDALLTHLGEDFSQPVICMCAFDWQWSHSGRLSHRTPDIAGDQLRGLLRGRIGAYLWTMLGTLEAFRAVGDFDEKLPRLQDLDFTIRFVARGGRLIMSDPRMPLCLYHKSDKDKPGRVIAESMAHIRRKHRPLFWQYGGRFRRGARRQHYLLAARHGFQNEGTSVGAWYSLLATLATPGLIFQALTRPFRSDNASKPSKPKELNTIREEWAGVAPIRRNTGEGAALDILVSCSAEIDEPLRSYLRSLGHGPRLAGIWYLPPVAAGLKSGARDHGGLFSLSQTDPSAAASVVRRLARLVSISNNDGVASLVYLGTPINLDQEETPALVKRVEELRQQLVSLAMVAREEVSEVRLHVIIPDSETLLWRRYSEALASGEQCAFDAWLQNQHPSFAEALDHQILKPLLSMEVFEATNVHLIVENSTLNDLRASIGLATGGSKSWPKAENIPIGLPTRHPGLPYGERLLNRYLEFMGRGSIDVLRRKFWSIPAFSTPRAPDEASMSWLEAHGDWTSYKDRFAPAIARTAAQSLEERSSPRHFRYPVASDEAFYKCIEELRILQLLARSL